MNPFKPDFYPHHVEQDKLEEALHGTDVGYPKLGYAKLVFADLANRDEVYRIEGTGYSKLQFTNWARQEFGYLRYTIQFGS